MSEEPLDFDFPNTDAENAEPRETETPVANPAEAGPQGLPWRLNAAQARVLGALMEKEATTPDYYPLSLNALVNA